MYTLYLRNLKHLLSNSFEGVVSLHFENDTLYVDIHFTVGEQYHLIVQSFSEKLDAGITSEVMANSIIRIFKKDILKLYLKN